MQFFQSDNTPVYLLKHFTFGWAHSFQYRLASQDGRHNSGGTFLRYPKPRGRRVNNFLPDFVQSDKTRCINLFSISLQQRCIAFASKG